MTKFGQQWIRFSLKKHSFLTLDLDEEIYMQSVNVLSHYLLHNDRGVR